MSLKGRACNNRAKGYMSLITARDSCLWQLSTFLNLHLRRGMIYTGLIFLKLDWTYTFLSSHNSAMRVSCGKWLVPTTHQHKKVCRYNPKCDIYNHKPSALSYGFHLVTLSLSRSFDSSNQLLVFSGHFLLFHFNLLLPFYNINLDFFCSDLLSLLCSLRTRQIKTYLSSYVPENKANQELNSYRTLTWFTQNFQSNVHDTYKISTVTIHKLCWI